MLCYRKSMKRLQFTVVLMVIAISSCVTSTPEARIKRQPATFLALSSKHQELVRRGEIVRGMPAEAVRLAWGNPSRRYFGLQNGQEMERWDYLGSQPVFTHQMGFGYGNPWMWGPGRWGGVWQPFIGPDVTYIPYQRATIVFRNRLVDSWEKLQEDADLRP